MRVEVTNLFRPSLESLDERVVPSGLSTDDSHEPLTTLEGQECLVFYLGGIPDSTRSNVYAVGLTVE